MKKYGFVRVCIACAIFSLGAWMVDAIPEINRALTPFSVGTAKAVEMLLYFLQMRPVREQSVLLDPTGFGYQIDFACTGIIPAGLLMVAILSSTIPLRAKVAGLTIGLPLTFAINLVRLVHLFYVGVHYPLSFQWTHSALWQSVMSVFLFGFYSFWLYLAQEVPSGQNSSRRHLRNMG